MTNKDEVNLKKKTSLITKEENKIKDDLLIEKLELINEYIKHKYQLETLIKSGCLHLAKARYINGRPNSISVLQLPTSESTLDVQAQCSVHLTQNDEEKENHIVENIKDKVEKVNSNDSNTSNFELVKHEDSKQNPIKWFGVLVSKSLRSGQSDFQKCISLTVEIANIQLKLQNINNKMKS